MSSPAPNAPLGVHMGRDTGIKCSHGLYLHFQMEAAKRGTCSHLWPTDALLPLSPPPPRSRAPPSQGEVRPHTTLCPFSSPLLDSDLIFLHFTLHEREALVSAHRVSGDFTQLPLQTSRVRSRSLGRSGNPMVFRN